MEFLNPVADIPTANIRPSRIIGILLIETNHKVEGKKRVVKVVTSSCIHNASDDLLQFQSLNARRISLGECMRRQSLKLYAKPRCAAGVDLKVEHITHEQEDPFLISRSHQRV
jgi:hypothetical protein